MPPLEAKPGGKEKGTVLVSHGFPDFAIAVALLMAFLTILSALFLVICVKI